MSGPIGTPTPLIDAVDKVTGRALFTGDFFFPNMLHVKFLRSPHPHARIVRIDISRAEMLPGVCAVAIGSDLPTPFGVLPISPDETAMAVEKTRYIGEIVAAVAAETEVVATEAVELIDVQYAPLRSFLTAEESLRECPADARIHSHSKGPTNIHKTAELRFGDPTVRLKSAPHTVREHFSFAGVTHAFLEPHATVATWNGDETLTVISATQVPHYLHRALATVLDFPMHRINVKKPCLGGGFGGKSDPFPHEIITAYMAKKTHRPVKCVFSREEVFLNNHGRHPTELDMSLACDDHGKLEALEADIVIDGGAYGSFGVVTTYYNGVLLQGPYRINDIGFRTRRVYTNKPQCGAMRGHGAVNPRYAVEVALDMLAEKAGIDPCDLRERNFLEADTLTVGQLRITSNGVRDCLKAVRERSGWDSRRGKLPHGRGLGVACGFYISGSAMPIIWNRYPQTVVNVKLDLDGGIVVFSGASDIGQGSDTMLAQVAAEVLGLPMTRIQVEAADTRLTPIDLGSYSSRVTFMVGNACKSAAENLRNKIADAVAAERGLKANAIRFENSCLIDESGAVRIPWDDAVEIALAGHGSLVETGYYVTPKLGGSFKGAGAGLSPAYSFGAFISEVEVNSTTGQVRVIKVWGAHDCGRALNPLAVEGQIQGCIHMGLGQALSEEMIFSDGRLLNASLADYHIPSTLDTPDMEVVIIESNDREGPFGAKEAGEGPIHPVLPSIGNAVYDAVGIRMFNLPITPDKVLAKLKSKDDQHA